MASPIESGQPSPVLTGEDMVNDPFVSSSRSGNGHLRYSNFDSNLFALGPGASPDQAKRALEAHLAETDRRMEEAGKLGTALVQQRKELAERLKEVEKLQTESHLGPELRQRLSEIEKDYNEVARESARAFLPKSRVPSNEAPGGSPFAPEGKGGRRSVSPSKFESQATGSPTKLSVPNRKLRNQPANRIHDIEFAAEISTSLIAQVRNLQGLLAEREEELRDIKVEKSQLEIEAEGFQQRMKTLDESEHRYKDENWNLETQIHELMSSQKEASDREKKMAQTLNTLQAAKNATQRELDEVKLTYSKLTEDHSAAVKHHDIELGTAKRNIAMAESERSAMQRKIEDLTNQNQELAKAFSMQRGRQMERDGALGMSDEDFDTATDNLTPEHSPPPSPVKGTPRHSMLESETLKTSLHHAQRTIQSLRTNVHREKTEKLELKRMLQDARDEMEKLRGDTVTGTSTRRNRKVDSREFRKPLKLGQLGGARSSRSDIYLEDPNWEDHVESGSAVPFGSPDTHRDIAPITESSDQFETANETSDAAFETARERGTETEDFQTGAEEFSDSDGGATETESPSRGAGRMKRPSMLPLGSNHGHRYSYQSTASTSGDEVDYTDLRTPVSLPPQKMRIRLSRGGLSRRSRQASEEPTFQSSPASFANSSNAGTPQQGGQSLFAELGDFEASDDESMAATPSRRSIRSATPGSFSRGRTTSPPPAVPALPKLIMVDSGVMTDPEATGLVPSTPTAEADPSKPVMVDSGVMTDDMPREFAPFPMRIGAEPARPVSVESVIGPSKSFASSQWVDTADPTEGEASRPLSMFSYSDAGAQHDPGMEEKLAKFPVPPTSLPFRELGPIPVLPPPQSLSFSDIQMEHVEPREQAVHVIPSPPLSLSSILGEEVEPKAEPAVAAAAPEPLAVSPLLSEQVEPMPETEAPILPPAPLSVSSLLSWQVEPRAEPEPPVAAPAPLSMSSLVSEDVEPEAVAEPIAVAPASLSMSYLVSEQVEPQAELELPLVIPEIPVAVPASLSVSPMLSEHVEPQAELEVPAAAPPPLSMSSLLSENVEPIIEPQVPVVTAALPAPAAPLSISSVHFQQVEPIPEAETEKPVPHALAMSAIHAEFVEPEVAPEEPLLSFSLSSVVSEETVPIVAQDVIPTPPMLDFSSIQSIETEPIEPPVELAVGPRSPKRNGFILPRDRDVADSSKPQTPTDKFFDSILGLTRGESPSTPIIAEDETRQSPSETPLAETPESQRPFREMSTNSNARPTRKRTLSVTDQSAQTALTSNAIDQMLKAKPMARVHQKSSSFNGSMGSPATVRIRRSQDSLNSVVRSKGKALDTDIDLSSEAAPLSPLRRPGSSASSRASFQNIPPLPPNHKKVIEAARTGSAGGVQGTTGPMGPPLFPASALRNAGVRPSTPVSKPMSPLSGRGTPTPRAGRTGSAHGVSGTADVSSPTRLTARSRQSSVSSFASEIDTRFNIQNNMGFDTTGLGPNTDPRMIQAITQTMIGEYLWKYTRKAGRGEMSEKRHRRYFWVHPYTRTLYWSDRDPSTAGRAELRAKSVPIEAVRVVTDDNPMPPGLHRKSLVVISPGRTIKFTCTTGQRHETWFNALSYLLLRTGTEGQNDTEEMAGNITREDVEEFNPRVGRLRTNGTRSRPPPSLSSYNSHTPRNESPAEMGLNVPTLTPTPHKKPQHSRPSIGTLSRLSGYWKSSQMLSGTFSSLRSRSTNGREQSIYEASAVHDSAEDLRKIYEKQDREADRLENVRACCDGKHDVGTLHQSSKRGRHGHQHTHTHPGPSTTPTPAGTVRSRA